MAIFGSSFTYNGISSDDYGIILCAVTQPDSIPMGLKREIIKGEITSNRSVANWYNTKYSDVLSFDITMTKPEDRAFSREEIRDINAWLTGPRTPALLFFEDEAFDPINYYGIFTDVTNTYGSGILMLTYTFTADSPYGWSNEREFKCTSQSATSNIKFEIINDTDELTDFIYPLFKIKSTPGTKITIENTSEISTDIKSCVFSFTFPSNLDSTLPIYIDSKYHRFYYKNNLGAKITLSLSDLGFTTNQLDNFDNGLLAMYWIRLIPGTNILNVSGKCDITATFRCPRKVGAY